MYRVYNILVKILGESKQGGYDKDCTQYQFNCCFCADEKGGVDGKYNLEVSFLLGKYHCWSCNSAGTISHLISRRGGKALLEEYKSIINEIKESRYYDLSLFKDNADMFKEKEYLKLPQTFEKINLDTCNDKQLVEYLKKRKITQDIIDRFNIGRTTWEESDWTWRNRIIFPSYDINGDLNYYIGRTYRTNDQRGKYKNCKADKNAIILHENLIQPDGLVILVEGAIDCIYGPNIISMMGKFINKKCKIYDYLVQKVRGPIYICLDGDTEDYETKKIYKLLNSTLALNGRIWYIRMGEGSLSEYKDFGDLYEAEGKEGIIKAIRSAKQYNEIDIAFLSKKRYINKKENGNKG